MRPGVYVGDADNERQVRIRRRRASNPFTPNRSPSAGHGAGEMRDELLQQKTDPNE